MLTLGIIPARSGSKGIKDKNIIPVGGQPLISWTIKQAMNAQLDRVIVSTDSKEYKEKIDSWFPGMDLVPFIRPAKLAKDDTPTSKVILNILDMCPEYDMFVLLEPTAPLRLTRNITEPLVMVRDGKAKAVVSVCASHRCHPAVSFELGMRDHKFLIRDTPSPRRQALRPYYHQTGTVYVADADWYREHKTFITSETVGYVVESWQDKEVDEESDIPAIVPFLERVK